MSVSSKKVTDLDLKLSQEYVQIVLGIDAFYRSSNQESSEAELAKEGLVPINLTNEYPRYYSSWDGIIEDLNEIRIKYLNVNDEMRRNYMQQQVGSLISLAKWVAKKDDYPFREVVRSLLYVNENPLVQSERDILHHKLNDLLSRKGFKGSLADKVQKWEEEQNVPSRELESVLKDLLASAKEQVVKKMGFPIEDVKVTPKAIYNVPYSAYCDYVNQSMYVNGDLRYTYASLKHLVTHESFPGHTTHMRVRELLTNSGDMPLDAALVITNTASSSVFEGIGDNGALFVDWVDSIDDEIYFVFQRIRSISGLNAAHMLHSEQKSEEEVRTFLKEFAFGDDNWIDSRLRFFNHSLRAPFIYAYWRGNQAVNEVYTRISPERKQDFFKYLYHNMHSADTIKQFS
ncbi:hypothetical protein NC797_15760 [Aquibacillus sp. 3ASR75-11]|uniref:DUF885 domain-containing protein n=1 Tax=Terrihalobacillus insolitus TaxID=2950438 RepID=A0A9X3WXF8_9BACI|nr:hypothetical protein [Terrihalobacillus insolitus]MDC3413793.1 hypothetical protein [Terrihalobacillus insolitus]MDC3425961.1 hypothetical protein [Terrihalobacillus insolitus]